MRTTDESCIVIIVVRAVRVAQEKTLTVAAMVVVLDLGRKPMQAFAEERNAGESNQQEAAQKTSILLPHETGRIARS
jgi:hypothetical protein